MVRLASLMILGLGLGLALAGCTRSNDAYCCTDPALCADVGGVVDDGCRAGTLCDDTGALEGVPHACVNDPAAVPCSGPDDCASPTPACVDRVCVPCATDADCLDATAARCDLGRCVKCDDGSQCKYFGSDTCSEAGVCVECPAIAEPAESSECAAGEPICVDPGICRGCTDHRECASGACDLASGACVAAADIAYVDGLPSTDTTCNFDDPCQRIAEGIATGRPYVVISAGSYQEDLAVATDVTLIGYGATVTARTNDVVALSVTGITTALAIFGLTIDNSAAGIDCSGGFQTATTRVTLVDATVSNHDGVGIVAIRCDLVLARSRLTNNSRGGAEVTQGGFDITNSVITFNGQLGTFGGLSLASPRPEPARLAFNTISGNSLGSGTAAPGVSCSSAVGLPAFHSNIIVGNMDGIDGAQVSGNPSCSYEHSLIDPPIAGTGNITGDPGYADAALHLLADSPAVDAGKPGTGVLDDIDGQVRPADLPDIGADEYVAP